MGEHAGCMDAVPIAEKRRVKGPLHCALPPVGLSPGITTHFPITIYQPLHEKWTPTLNANTASELLRRDASMACAGSVRRSAQRETGFVGRAECAGGCGGFWDLLFVVHVAADIAEPSVGRLFWVESQDAGWGVEEEAVSRDALSDSGCIGWRFVYPVL